MEGTGKMKKFMECDFSKWKVNMHVVIINARADVRLVSSEKCLGAHTKYGSLKIKDGYCTGCSYFMGCNTPSTGYIGTEMAGCCWKKILEEVRQ